MIRWIRLVAAVLLFGLASSCVSNRPVSGEVRPFLEQSIQQSQSREEVAVLRGLVWLDEFIQDDENLHYIFSDYLLMLNELAHRRPGPVATAAHRMIHEAAARGAEDLDEIFSNSASGKWDFISVVAILESNDVPSAPFLTFYQQFFTPDISLEMDYLEEFNRAVKALDYDTLGDILIDTSFGYFYREKYPDSGYSIPPNRFAHYLDRVTHLPYIEKYGEDEDGYSDQNYYVTHVVFVATDYGQDPMPEGELLEEMQDYLQREFYTVWRQVKDIDLTAEFIHCYKLCGLGDRPEVREASEYLMSLQHKDGSWGTEEDFEGDPYDVFHPTWTVITALNY